MKKKEKNVKKELDYFLNDGIQYLHYYPQIFLAVITLSLQLDKKIDIEKLLACTFEKMINFITILLLGYFINFYIKQKVSRIIYCYSFFYYKMST